MEQLKDRKDQKGINPALVLISFCIFIILLFNLIYHLPVKDTLVWLAGVVFLFYIPGNLILKWADLLREEYIMNVFHSIALGVALMPLPYSIIRSISHPEFIYILGGATLFIWFILNIKKSKYNNKNYSVSYDEILTVSILIMSIIILLHLSHFTDVILIEEGFKIRKSDFTETDFHLGIINNLKDTYPPSLIYASGIDHFPYHFNMHLEIEMFQRILSIESLKLTYFYFPFLYFCLLIVVPYIFVREIGGRRSIAIMTGLIMFGSDFSFIPGILGLNPSSYPWTVYFKSTIWSIFTLNGILPAISIMVLCFLYLKIYYDDKRLRHLLLFAIISLSLYGFKSSMGVHIVGSSLLASIVSGTIMKDRKFSMSLSIMSLFTLIIIAIDLIYMRGGAGNTIVSINIFNELKNSLARLGVNRVSIVLYPIFFSIYVIAVYGIRMIGFIPLKKEISGKQFDIIFVFIAIFAIAGFLLSEMLYIGIPSGEINNSAWFAVQSLVGSWLLVSYYLIKIQNARKVILYMLFIVLLSMPSTVQFLYLRYNLNYNEYGKNELEIIRYLETTPPNSVILFPPNTKEPSLASNLAGRQSVYSIYHSFVSQNIGQTEAEKRLKDISIFFRSKDPKSIPFILSKYKVDYVYASLKYAERYDSEDILKQILKNEKYVLYKVNK